MAQVLDDLMVYINSQSSAFTIGGLLWKDRMPDTPDTAVGLVEILGFEPPAEHYGPSGSFNIERPQIQVLSRAAQDDYPTARTNSETVYKILRNVYNYTTGINGTNYYMIAPRSTPYYQGEDDNSRHYLSFTLDVWKDPSS